MTGGVSRGTTAATEEEDVGVGIDWEFDWGFDWEFDWGRAVAAVPVFPALLVATGGVGIGTIAGGGSGDVGGNGINCGDKAKYCNGNNRIERCLRGSSMSMGEP